MMKEELLIHYIEGKEIIMILDIGAPMSLAGQKWIKKYLREYGMNMADFKVVECYQIFKFGPSKQYVSKRVIELLIVVIHYFKKYTLSTPTYFQNCGTSLKSSR